MYNKLLKKWLGDMLVAYDDQPKIRHFIRTKFMAQTFAEANEVSGWLYEMSEDERLSSEVLRFIEIALIKVESGHFH